MLGQCTPQRETVFICFLKSCWPFHAELSSVEEKRVLFRAKTFRVHLPQWFLYGAQIVMAVELGKACSLVNEKLF